VPHRIKRRERRAKRFREPSLGSVRPKEERHAQARLADCLLDDRPVREDCLRTAEWARVPTPGHAAQRRRDNQLEGAPAVSATSDIRWYSSSDKWRVLGTGSTPASIIISRTSFSPSSTAARASRGRT
jgi:hypothetical protein